MNRGLVATTASAVAVVGWTVAASAAFLWFADGTWQVWEPGPFWNSRYFAQGIRWTWAWISYATTPSTWSVYGATLVYTGGAVVAVAGVFAFRIGQMLGFFGGNRPSLYGHTKWAGKNQMTDAGIVTKNRPF